MFVFVSDLFVQDYVGGGELTTEAILQKTNAPVIKVRSSQVTPQHMQTLKDRHWIFGNFSGLSTEMILMAIKNLNYSVIEYDYKFCKYRLPQKHIAATGKCDCDYSSKGKMVSSFFAMAKTLWFMSEEQKKIYTKKYPFLEKPSTRVLSSVFSEKSLKIMENYSDSVRNDIWLIQKSDSWVKGTEDAIQYAENNNLKYELFSGIEHEKLLDKFSKYKGFIFLPRGHDTCPRTVIEAKILGCKLILNDNVQHSQESWFTGDRQAAMSYLKTRPREFWKEIYKHTRLPNHSNSEEQSHFKIIIPVYNSQEWIAKSIKSVLKQKYNNYQCIVCDDISTDKTWDIINSFEHDKLIKIKNKTKKYALKNIHDAINLLNPADNDIIIVLDGDDWLSNNHVLSKLNQYYEENSCNMTYGSFVRFPDGSIGQESSKYSEETIRTNAFRRDEWRASHLRTFKYFLWNSIKEEDLKDESGQFYEVSYDQAMMLPMLEMSGHKSLYIPEVLCVYNVKNPNAVNQTRQKFQYETMLKIREKQPYKKME